MNRVLGSLCLALVAAGCAAPPTRLTGLYRFPDAAELHHPVLLLRDNGTFAFLTDAGEAEHPESYPNHGTFTRRGDTLQLRYDKAECCQFADVTTEDLVVQPDDGGGLRVVFRGRSWQLVRETIPP